MHKPSSFRDYLIATLITACILVGFSLYLFLRRGYFFDAPLTADLLYVPNKALAGTAMTLLAFTFLIGPITRYFDRFDQWLSYRKEIGIVAAFLAVAHGLVSYYLLPLKFPNEWIEFSTPEFGAGLVGVLFLVLLYILSFKKIILLVHGGPWWFLQRWGLRAVIILTLIHVFALKWSGWVTWLKQGGSITPELAHPFMPGLGILVTLFIVWVVVVRLYESLFLFKDFGFKSKEIVMDVTLKARGRRFFIWSFWIFVLLFVLVLTRFI